MILNSVCPSTPVKRGRIRKHRALGGRKSNGLADLLRLPEMPPVMRSYYQQPGADREAKKSNEWVAKANPVQVKTRAFLNDRSNLLLRVKECLQCYAGHVCVAATISPGDLSFLFGDRSSVWMKKRLNHAG